MATNIFKILGYEGVFDIIRVLKDGQKTFSFIMFKTKLNPGVLNRLLKILINSNIVKKSNNGSYHLTTIGHRALKFAVSYDKEYCRIYSQNNTSSTPMEIHA